MSWFARKNQLLSVPAENQLPRSRQFFSSVNSPASSQLGLGTRTEPCWCERHNCVLLLMLCMKQRAEVGATTAVNQIRGDIRNVGRTVKFTKSHEVSKYYNCLRYFNNNNMGPRSGNWPGSFLVGTALTAPEFLLLLLQNLYKTQKCTTASQKTIRKNRKRKNKNILRSYLPVHLHHQSTIHPSLLHSDVHIHRSKAVSLACFHTRPL